MKLKTRPPGRSQKGRGTFSCYHLTSQTAHTACLSERRGDASLFQPDNGCCNPAQPTENHGTFRSVRSSGMYSQCVSRAPLICRLLSVRYLGLLLVPFQALGMCVSDFLHANIPHYKGDARKCQGADARMHSPEKHIFARMSAYKKHLCFLHILCIIAFGLSSTTPRKKEERL